ncbi:MAG: pantetheine-phosphate adenylyltransferase [Paracoccaceae bacterium]
MRIGLYPGTFDPLTLGHLDIIRRASYLVDKLVVGVAVNSYKSPMFNLQERVNMINEEISIIESEFGIQIVTHPFENLLIECAKDVKANIIIRGLRAVSDFEYEFQMVGMNRVLSSDIETVFLMADNSYQSIASKLVKEIARLGGDTKNFVPNSVNKRLMNLKNQKVK